MILKTVFLRSHEVATLVLSDSDIPRPGGGGGGGVNVQFDGHTGVTSRHKHVLAGIVATNYWWGSVARNTDCESVGVTMTQIYAVKIRRLGSDRGSQYHGVKVNSQFADICIVLAVSVGAGVRVRGGGVGAYCAIGRVGGGCSSAGQREDTTDSEG